MKTFADLTDTQFSILHSLVWDAPQHIPIKVSHYNANISVWQTRDADGNMTEFDGVRGEIFRLSSHADAPKVIGSKNIWHIVALCKEWDLAYVNVDVHVY